MGNVGRQMPSSCDTCLTFSHLCVADRLNNVISFSFAERLGPWIGFFRSRGGCHRREKSAALRRDKATSSWGWRSAHLRSRRKRVTQDCAEHVSSGSQRWGVGLGLKACALPTPIPILSIKFVAVPDKARPSDARRSNLSSPW